ncbi:MAG: hypothetical protein FWG35_06755 [Spirochaetaceae bacterium]|nr:hypothetical protein [Spirochaetaceae bacterium]
MFYKLLGHPSLWFFFAGLFLGGIIAVLLPRKYRAGRLAKIFFLLTGAVASGTVALFFSGSESPARFLPAVLGGLLLAAPALRFKRAAGIPIFLVCAGALVLGSNTLSGWDLARGEDVVCHVLVLSAEGDQAVLSVKVPGGAEILVNAPAAGLRVTTQFLRIPPAYPFFGVLPLYRVTAVRSEEKEYELASGGLPAEEESSLALPGIRIETFETELPPLQRFSACELALAPDTLEPYFRNQ